MNLSVGIDRFRKFHVRHNLQGGNNAKIIYKMIINNESALTGEL